MLMLNVNTTNLYSFINGFVGCKYFRYHFLHTYITEGSLNYQFTTRFYALAYVKNWHMIEVNNRVIVEPSEVSNIKKKICKLFVDWLCNLM